MFLGTENGTHLIFLLGAPSDVPRAAGLFVAHSDKRNVQSRLCVMLTPTQTLKPCLSPILKISELRCLQVVEGVSRAADVPEASRPQLSALAHLEAALVEHVYSHPAGAAPHLEAAQDAVGFSAELTGATL